MWGVLLGLLDVTSSDELWMATLMLSVRHTLLVQGTYAVYVASDWGTEWIWLHCSKQWPADS